MATLLNETEHIARKTHIDNGSQYFDWMTIMDNNRKLVVDPKEAFYLNLTDQEVKEIQHSIGNKWRIQIGETYVKQASVDGEFYIYKTRKEINKICLKYNLYTEE